MPKDFLQYKQLPLSNKSVNIEESIFDGFSAGMGNEDHGRDIIDPAAFNKTISERVEAGKVKFLDQHSTNSTKRLWGSVIEAKVERVNPQKDNGLSHRLWSRFAVSKADPDAQVALGKIAEGHLDALSIGFKPIRVAFEADDEEWKEDPEFAWLLGKGTRIIEELAWWETSAVIWGMNEEAVTIQNSVKSILSFAHKITKEGKQVDEEKVRQLIHALNSTLENPEALGKSGISDTVQRLDEMVALLEKRYKVNIVDDLRDIYYRYKEENDTVNKESFMVWVSENIVGQKTEDKQEKELDEECMEEGSGETKESRLEKSIGINPREYEGEKEGELSRGFEVNVYNSDDIFEFLSLDGYIKVYPELNGVATTGNADDITVSDIDTADSTTDIITWKWAFEVPEKDSDDDEDDEEDVEAALDDVKDVVDTLQEQVDGEGDAPRTKPDKEADAAKVSEEDRREHVEEEEKDETLSEEEEDLVLFELELMFDS